MLIRELFSSKYRYILYSRKYTGISCTSKFNYYRDGIIQKNVHVQTEKSTLDRPQCSYITLMCCSSLLYSESIIIFVKRAIGSLQIAEGVNHFSEDNN